MQRRRFLQAAGAAGLGVTAGCSSVSEAIPETGPAADFPFPPGWGPDGVQKPQVAFRYHDRALADKPFTATFEIPGLGDDGGVIDSAGTGERRRSVVDNPESYYTELYREPGVKYAGVSADADDRFSHLTVGDWETGSRFPDALRKGVGIVFKRARSLPFGAGSFEVRDEDEDPRVGVFTVDSIPDDKNWTGLEELRIEIGAAGAIRDIEARFTPNSAAQDADQMVYSYDLTLGESPPDERVQRPERLTKLPTFGVDFQQDNRVMAVTNTGGSPVGGEDTGMEAFGIGPDERRTDVDLEPVGTLPAGETAYVAGGDDGLQMTASPPESVDGRPPLAGELAVRFHYYHEREDEVGGPYEVQYSTDCDGLDC